MLFFAKHKVILLQISRLEKIKLNHTTDSERFFLITSRLRKIANAISKKIVSNYVLARTMPERN